MKRKCSLCKSEIEINFKEHDFGDLMTISEFLEEVNNATLTDDDGTGYYSFENKRSDYKFDFNDYILFEIYDKRFTHIAWYNR